MAKRGNILSDKPLWRIVIFFALSIVAALALTAIDFAYRPGISEAKFAFSMLFATVFIEMISPGGNFRTLGFSADKFTLRQIIKAALLPLPFFALIVATGLVGAVPQSFDGNFSVFGFALQAVIVIIAAFAEELLMRGTVYQSLERSLRPGILNPLSSLAFAGLHIAAPGYGITAFVNVFLANIMLNAVFSKTRSLFATTAIHAIWNLSLSALIGCSVSGMAVGPKLISTDLGSYPFTDTVFGFEGGLLATLIILCLIGASYKIFDISPQVSSAKYLRDYRRPEGYQSEILK